MSELNKLTYQTGPRFFQFAGQSAADFLTALKKGDYQENPSLAQSKVDSFLQKFKWTEGNYEFACDDEQVQKIVGQIALQAKLIIAAERYNTTDIASGRFRYRMRRDLTPEQKKQITISQINDLFIQWCRLRAEINTQKVGALRTLNDHLDAEMSTDAEETRLKRQLTEGFKASVSQVLSVANQN